MKIVEYEHERFCRCQSFEQGTDGTVSAVTLVL